MRGSPLIRFLFIALALLAAGAGLARVISAKSSASPPRPVSAGPPAAAAIPFHLTLSAPAAEIVLDGRNGDPLTGRLDGKLILDPANPGLAITIRWKSKPVAGEHRFAKLTLEPPGQATFTRVFDAPGDIEDFLELPAAPGK